MKYLKQFTNESDYQAFKESEDYILPNVSFVTENKHVGFYPKPNLKVTLTYGSGNYWAFQNGSEHITKLVVDGEAIDFEPFKKWDVHSVQILASEIEMDQHNYQQSDIPVDFPDEYLMNFVPSYLKIHLLNEWDTTYSMTPYVYIYQLTSDGKVALHGDLSYNMYSYFTFNSADQCLVAKEKFFEDYTEAYVNGDRWAVGVNMWDNQTEQYIRLDCVQEYGHCSGGLQTPYYFETEGEHVVEMTWDNSEFGEVSMFGYTDVTSAKFGNGFTKIKQNTFSYANYLSNLILGRSIEEIEKNAFSSTNISSLVVPDKTKIIGDNAFKYTPIKSLVIGTGCEEIGMYAFAHTNELEAIVSNAKVAPKLNNSFNICKGFGKLIYPIGSDYSSWLSLDELGGEGWNQQRPVLRCIYRSDNGSKWCDDKFKYYSRSFTYNDDGTTTVDFILDSTRIPDHAFGEYYNKNVVKLLSVYIPEGVYSIGQGAFYNNWLEYAYISSTVTSMSNSAFQGEKLSNVEFSPDSKMIDFCGFGYGSVITEMIIPESVENITYGALQKCKKLKTVTIGSNCKTIDSWAFGYCESLTEIICMSKIAPAILYDSAFSGISTTGILKVPTGSDYSSWLELLPSGWTVQYI